MTPTALVVQWLGMSHISKPLSLGLWVGGGGGQLEIHLLCIPLYRTGKRPSPRPALTSYPATTGTEETHLLGVIAELMNELINE